MQETLDPALTRPGRFDRRVAVPVPDVRGRLEILEHYLKVLHTLHGESRQLCHSNIVRPAAGLLHSLPFETGTCQASMGMQCHVCISHQLVVNFASLSRCCHRLQSTAWGPFGK